MENMENVFYFITKEVEFQESEVEGARVEVTVMELNKASEGNNRIYKIEEGDEIAKSLVGNDIYHGIDWRGKHDNPIVNEDSQNEPIGFVESAKVVGNKIKAIIRIINKSFVERLKNGVKFLFSVGGNAVSETIKKIGNKIVHVLHGARCNHLQMLDVGTPVGFPNAKTERLIEINETVMICEGGLCHCGEAPMQNKARIVNTGEIIDTYTYKITRRPSIRVEIKDEEA